MHDPTHEYDDECEGCQPSMMDATTGQIMSKDHPVMIAVLKAWKGKTTLIERRATSRVWMNNSRNPQDIEIMQRVAGIMQEAVQEVEGKIEEEVKDEFLSEFDKRMKDTLDADQVHGSDEQ